MMFDHTPTKDDDACVNGVYCLTVHTSYVWKDRYCIDSTSTEWLLIHMGYLLSSEAIHFPYQPQQIEKKQIPRNACVACET